MSSDSNHENSYLKGDRLRIARERRGLTQRELSRLLGIGENQINKYENGGADPSLRNLYMIAAQLQVTTDYLMGLSDTPTGYSIGELSNNERLFLDAYKTGDALTVVKLLSDRVRELENEAD